MMKLPCIARLALDVGVEDWVTFKRRVDRQITA
jgi:hypothetical protein